MPGGTAVSRWVATDAPMVRAEGVARRYGTRAVLTGIDLALRPGDALLVRGRSGSGKSTLLHLLAGIDTPSAGKVTLAGQDLSVLDASARAALRLRSVGLVFQHFNLLPDLTAEENVRLPLHLAGAPAGPARARAGDLLARVGLAAHAAAFPSMLSGGELQRVAVARALANDPALVLADEPTANLDEASAQVVLQLLAGLARDGRAVLVASHDGLALEAFPRAAHLVDGRLAASPRGAGEQGGGQADRDGGEP